MNNQSHKSLLESINIITEDVPEKYQKFTRTSPEERAEIPVDQRTRWQYGKPERYTNQIYSHAFESAVHQHMQKQVMNLYDGMLHQHANTDENIEDHHNDIVSRMPEHEQSIIHGLHRKMEEHTGAVQMHNVAATRLGMGSVADDKPGSPPSVNSLSAQNARQHVYMIGEGGVIPHDVLRQHREQVHAHAGGYDGLMKDHLPKIDIPPDRSTANFGGPAFRSEPRRPRWKSGGASEGMEAQES